MHVCVGGVCVRERERENQRKIEYFFTFGGGGGGGGGYTVGADILSSADWYHHSIIWVIYIIYNVEAIYL